MGYVDGAADGRQEQRRGFYGRKGWAVEAGWGSSGFFDSALRASLKMTARTNNGLKQATT
jgi:hypothetical protein